VQVPDADYGYTDGPLSRYSGGAGSGPFSLHGESHSKVDIRRGTAVGVTRQERRHSWRSAVSAAHSGVYITPEQPNTPAGDRSFHGDSRWLAGGVAQELLLWQLGEQVDLSGGLHSGKRHRRDSLASYGPAASQPGAPATFDDEVHVMLGPAALLGRDAEVAGLLSMLTGSHSVGGGASGEAGGELWASGKLSYVSGVSGNALLPQPAPVCVPAVATAAAAGCTEHIQGGAGGQPSQPLLEPDLQQLQQQSFMKATGAHAGVHGASGGLVLLPVNGVGSGVPASVKSSLLVVGTGAGAGRAAVPLVPTPEILQSLRRANSGVGGNDAMSLAGTELSTAGFVGVSINQTCRAMMSARWLWARQLLIHDLGAFK
jgi:hypothetical protein